MGREQYGSKDKFLNLTAIATILFSSLPANTSVFISAGKITPYAKKRNFQVLSTLDQSLTNVTLRPVFGGASASLGSILGYANGVGSFTLQSGANIVNYDMGLVGDTVYFVATVGTTAPTTGYVSIKVAEVI